LNHKIFKKWPLKIFLISQLFQPKLKNYQFSEPPFHSIAMQHKKYSSNTLKVAAKKSVFHLQFLRLHFDKKKDFFLGKIQFFACFVRS
jgi:hypothetical protein